MKVKELIKIGNVAMKMLHERGISMDYYQHLPMMEEFDIMKNVLGTLGEDGQILPSSARCTSTLFLTKETGSTRL